MYTADLVRILNNVTKIDKLNGDPDTQGAYLINRRDHLIVLATNGNILYWEQAPLVNDEIKLPLGVDFDAEKPFFPCRITPDILQRTITRLKAESKTSLVHLFDWERNCAFNTEVVTLEITTCGKASYEAIPVQSNEHIKYGVRDADVFYERFILHERDFLLNHEPMPFNTGFSVPAKQMAVIGTIMAPRSKTDIDGMSMMVYGAHGMFKDGDDIDRYYVFPRLVDIRDWNEKPEEQTRGVVVTTMNDEARKVYFI